VADRGRRSSSSAILLLVALRGPSSPYDLKRSLERLTGQFWAVPHTNVYDEVGRLAAEGLVSVERAAGGRRRQTLTLTEAGRAELTEWLHAPTPTGMEIRDEAQLKLLGSELTSPDQVRRLALEQVRVYEERLAALEATEAFGRAQPDLAGRFLAVPLGRAVLTAARDFWQSLADG
jgi:DNA-binding PadR family transcriptional regulator